MSEDLSLKDIKKFWPDKAPDIKNVSKYVSKYKEDKIVIKCGGNVLIDPELFKNFIDDVVVLNKLGLTTIIVHGGGPRIKNKLHELGIESKFIRGLRVTDKKIIEIVENVLIEFNKEIASALKDQNCNTKRITSKEVNIMIVKRVSDDLGFVGTPYNINTDILKKIIQSNEVPIIAPLGLNEKDQTFNINADTAAGSLAKALKARRLLIVSDVEGVLDKNNKLITEINSNMAKEMVDKGIISGGMIPKIHNCLDVASNGVKGVVIIDGRKNHSILFELLSDKGSGTLIRK